MRSLVVGESFTLSTHDEDNIYYINGETFISLPWIAEDGRLFERWVDGEFVNNVVLPIS